jgi:hypothetical protein
MYLGSLLSKMGNFLVKYQLTITISLEPERRREMQNLRLVSWHSANLPNKTNEMDSTRQIYDNLLKFCLD